MEKTIKMGTGGFRGVLLDDFNKENVQLITQALATVYIQGGYKSPIVVGYDYRFMSDFAATWVSEVLAGNGIHVLLSKEASPTPTIMYISKKMHNDFGIMITASHNPYYFNGIKIFQEDGMDADLVLTSAIENNIESIEDIQCIESFDERYNDFVTKVDVVNDYVDFVSTFISDKIKGSNIKVLFDAFHGTGGITIPKLAEKFDLKNITSRHIDHETMFGNMLPNPTKKNMESLSKLVIDGGYDVAMGIDSDGDRLGVLDEHGNLVNNHDILACLYYYLVKYKGLSGDIVKNIATSEIVDKLADKFNFKCHMVDVGFKNISSMMKKKNALIGGESSGGLTVRGYIFGKDSTFSAFLFLEMMAVMNKPVSEIVKECKEFANYSNLDVELSISYHDSFDIKKYLNDFVPKFHKNPIKVFKLNKNVKYYFDNEEWVLIRISGTEPVLRVFIEAKDDNEIKQYEAALKEFVDNIK